MVRDRRPKAEPEDSEGGKKTVVMEVIPTWLNKILKEETKIMLDETGLENVIKMDGKQT